MDRAGGGQSVEPDRDLDGDLVARWTGRSGVADRRSHRVVEWDVAVEWHLHGPRQLHESDQRHGSDDPRVPAVADLHLDSDTRGRGDRHAHALSGGCAAYPPVR